MTEPPEWSIGLAEMMLVEARSELTLADGKAAILLSLLGVGTGAAIAAMFAGWSPLELTGFSEVAWWSGAGIVFASGYFLGRVLWPNLGTRNSAEPITFWGQVAATKSVEALRDRLADDNLSRGDRVLHQLYAVSTILRAKYERLRRALVLLSVGVVCFLVSALAAGG